MASKTLVARLAVDASGVNKGLSQTEQSTSKIGGVFSKLRSTASSAFSGIGSSLSSLGVVPPEVSEAFSGLSEHLSETGERLKELEGEGAKLQKIGTVAAGVGAGGIALGAAFTAMGSKVQTADNRLAASISNTGHNVSQFHDQLADARKEGEHFGESNVEVEDALTSLTTGLHNPTLAFKSMEAAEGLAQTQHISLNSAAMELTRTMAGSTRSLQSVGISGTALAKSMGITSLTTATASQRQAFYQKTLQLVTARTKGLAEAHANTWGGKFDAVKATVEDMAARLGQKYGPAITAVGGALTGLGAATNLVGGLMKTFARSEEVAETATKVATASTEAMTAATEAAAPAEMAAGAAGEEMGAGMTVALGPIGLVIAAVAAAIAIGYEIYKHWGQISKLLTGVWRAISGEATAIWGDISGFFTKWWSQTTGRFNKGVATVEAIPGRAWRTIRNTTTAVWGQITTFFRRWWPEILAIFTGPLGLAVGLIAQHWRLIYTTTVRIWHTVESAVAGGVTNAVHWVSTLPGRAVAALGNLGSRLWAQGSQMLLGFLRGVEAADTTVIRYIRGIPARVVSGLGNLGNLLWNEGQNLLIGLWRGAESEVNSVASSIASSVKSAIPSGIRKVLGIGSPAKITMPMGEYLMQGLEVGAVNYAATAAANVARSAAQVARGAAGGLASIATPAMSVAPNVGPLGAAGGIQTGGMTVNVTVQGNVMTAQQLVDAVHQGLLQKARRTGMLFPATAIR